MGLPMPLVISHVYLPSSVASTLEKTKEPFFLLAVRLSKSAMLLTGIPSLYHLIETLPGLASPAHSNYSERDPPNSKYNDLGEHENQAVALFPVCQIKSVLRIICFF